MNKIYYLASCSTCQEIIRENGIAAPAFPMQDIRTDKITSAQLEEMKQFSGSFESLFSRRALKYKELGLKDQSLNEADYKKYILQEDTFLKRPVVILGRRIFIGSEKKTRSALQEAIRESLP